MGLDPSIGVDGRALDSTAVSDSCLSQNRLTEVLQTETQSATDLK